MGSLSCCALCTNTEQPALDVGGPQGAQNQLLGPHPARCPDEAVLSQAQPRAKGVSLTA